MPKTCVKTVHNWCISTSKKCVRLSTPSVYTPSNVLSAWVQALLMPQLSTTTPTGFSTTKYPILPLLHIGLYPLSTAPTIITTKNIL